MTEAFPKLVKVRQAVSRAALVDVERAVSEGAAELVSRLPHGSRVAVCVGSRGIGQIPIIVAAAVRQVRASGHDPFVLAAMGSHGGGNAAGQRELLESLGVTEGSVGAPVVVDDRSVVVGKTPQGLEVYTNPTARDVAGLLLINRVKPHTTLRPPLGSGLCKMLAVGLGNRAGATQLHGSGMPQHLGEFVALLRKELPLLGGLAIVEDGAGRAARIEPVPASAIESKDRELLVTATKLMPGVPVDPLDVLVITRMGKEISGTGMDPNVIGVHRRLGGEPDRHIGTIGVLDLTDASHGNATGIGMADLTTTAMTQKIDWQVTRTNCNAGGFTNGYRQPETVEHDRALFRLALSRYENPRLAVIRDTKSLEELWISENLVEGTRGELDVLAEPVEIQFDAEGRLRLDLLLGSA